MRNFKTRRGRLAVCGVCLLQLTFLCWLSDTYYRSSFVAYQDTEVQLFLNGIRTTESNKFVMLSKYENIWTLDREDCQSTLQAPMLQNPLEMDESAMQTKDQASKLTEKARSIQRTKYNRSSFTYFRNDTQWLQCLSTSYLPHFTDGTNSTKRVLYRFSHSNMDVVIPTARFTCLNPMAIRNLNYFQGPRRIFVITPFDVSLCGLFEDIANNVICLPESNFSDHLTVSNIKDMIPPELKVGRERAGWYFQQFIKLGVSQWIQDLSDYYVVWDGDFIPINGRPWVYQRRKQTFLSTDLGIGGGNKKLHLSTSCYKQTYQNFFGNPGHLAHDGTTHVAHQMVMSKHEVIHMLTKMSVRKLNYTVDTNLSPLAKTWASAIMSSVTESFHSSIRQKRKRCDKVGFSEYHSYASFVQDTYGPASVCQNFKKSFHRKWAPTMPKETKRSKGVTGACCPTEEWLCDQVRQLGNEITYVGIELGQTDNADTCGWNRNKSPIYP